MTDLADWEASLTAALQHALAYRASLVDRPVAAATLSDGMTAALEDLRSMPVAGLAAEQVLEELVQRAAPGLTAMSGPRFFGWVTGGTLPAAVAADWMTAIWDQNAGPAEGAPAASAFEHLALGWVTELLRLPAEARGGLVTGAMAANLVSLAAARSHVLAATGWDVEQDGLSGAPPVQVLCGHERHDTIDKALRVLGLGKRALFPIDIDSEGRMSAQKLKRQLARCSGPVIVCAQAGNVNSGAFDPLEDIAKEVAEHRARTAPHLSWLHIDGAFGLWARAAATTAELARGAEHADSWATDAHKFLNVPYDSGIVLTRHPQAHRRAMAIQGAYLSSGSVSKTPTPGAFALELSRRARGFALFAALRQLGRRGLEDLVSRCVAHARLLANELRKTQGLHVENRVVFNQVVLRAEAPNGVEPAEWTVRLVRAIQREGTCYPTPTLWRGTPCIRFSLINAQTTSEDVLRSAHAVARVYQGLL